MSKLLVNELSKVWKQIGFRILIILIIVTFAISPFISYFTSMIDVYEAEYIHIDKDYKEALKLSKSRTEQEYEKYNAKLKVDAITFFKNNYPEWKYQVFGQRYFSIYSYIQSYKDIQSGIVSKSDTIYSGIDDSRMGSMYDANVQSLDELIREINETTVKDFYEPYVETVEELYSVIEMKYESNKTQYEREQTESNKLALEKLELLLGLWKDVKDTFEYLDNNEIEPLRWRVDLLTNAYHNINTIDDSYPTISEAEYIEYENGGIKYKNYVYEGMLVVNGNKEALSNYVYSVRENIPVKGTEMSNKGVVRSAFISIEGVFWFGLAIIGGSVVAKEFSSGTARMLLIRPRKRSAILTSKVLTLLIYYLGLTFIGIILQTLCVMIFFGVDDIFSRTVVYAFGKSIGVPFILSFLKLYIEKAVVTIFYMFVSLTFASLTKKTVVSVIIVYAVHSGMGLLSTVFGVIKSIVPNMPIWLNYTPLPFLESIGSNGNLIDNLMSIIGISKTISYGYFYSWIGVLYYLVFVAIMVFTSYKSFTKTQVTG